jgi:hypothetical protein
MQPLGELARERANEPPTPPTERLSAGRQLNAIIALALLAAPSVRGCPMKADIAIFLSEARFKANVGDFFAGADDRPSQSRGATTRVGAPCQSPTMRGRKRCRLHGGLSLGAPRGARNGNFTDGSWTAEAIEERRWIQSLIRSFGKLENTP